MTRRLLIRADANSEIGFGHVMRTLALAQRWRDTIGPVAFLCATIDGSLLQRLTGEGISVQKFTAAIGSHEDARQTILQAEESGADAVVFDSYQFDAEYQLAIRGAPINSVTLLLDDDGRFDRYHTDIVLNQNIGANRGLYATKISPSCGPQLLLGSHYTLLREEFRDHKPREQGGKSTRILVTLGGYDPGNVTQQVIDAIGLLSLDDLQITLVSKLSGLKIDDSRIDLVEFTSDMAELYSQADFAICAGGSTNWELSYFGVPRLVIVLAKNQLGIASELSVRNCVQSLGWFANLDAAKIAGHLEQLLQQDETTLSTVRENNRQLIDGGGAKRVVKQLVKTIEKRRGEF